MTQAAKSYIPERIPFWVRCACKMTGWISRVVITPLYRVRARGWENLPRRGGAIVVSNHASFLDPIVLQAISKRVFVFPARRSLDQHWLYRFLTSRFATVPISRGEPDFEATRKLLRFLLGGEIVALFPEQTRSPDGQLQALTSGFHLLARRSGVPVLPVWIEGSYDVWPRSRSRPRWTGRIEAVMGPAIDVRGLSRDEGIDTIRRAFLELQAQCSGATPGASDTEGN